MFDVLQVIFWSLAYVIIIYNGIKNPRDHILMPLLPGCLNFAWEANALIVSKGFWSHILWLVLDIAIFTLNLRKLEKRKLKVFYCSAAAASIAVFWIIFRLPNIKGMLISSFVIDFIMAADYAVTAKRISGSGKIIIAITKLLGDLFAWLYYRNQMKFVAVIGIMVLILNLYYLIYCIKEISLDRKSKETHSGRNRIIDNRKRKEKRKRKHYSR